MSVHAGDTAMPPPTSEHGRRRLRTLCSHVSHKYTTYGAPPGVSESAAVGAAHTFNDDVTAVVTAAKQSQFRDVGFVVLESAFTAEQMARLEQDLQAYIAEDMPAQAGNWDGTRYLAEAPGDLSTVWRISPLSTPLIDALGANECTALWEAVFGVEAVPYSSKLAQFFDKCPGGTKTTPAHQVRGKSARDHVSGDSCMPRFRICSRFGALKVARVVWQDGGFSIGGVPREVGFDGCAEEGNVVIALDDMDLDTGCASAMLPSHAGATASDRAATPANTGRCLS